MRQDPSNPFIIYTVEGERITIAVKATKISPLVEGAGPPTFIAHPPDFKKNTRVFEFVEANPPDVDAVVLVFSFVGKSTGAKYTVKLSSNAGGAASLPPVTEVPGLSIQHLGLLFEKNAEANL
jgi:hypothetical protein